jgi:hypothetical protein
MALGDFERQHQDVLQNIEAAIVEVYRANPALLDYDAEGGLEALVAHYTAELQGRPPRGAPSDANRRRVFESVQEVCEWRLGRADLPGVPPMTPIPMETLVACLKRVRKSVQGWTRRAGRQGYLAFVSQYV